MKTAALAMLLLTHQPSLAAEDWVWYHPPSSVSKADRLGLTHTQILKMGRQKWLTYSLHRPRDAKESVARHVDGEAVVFGACLQWRNDKLVPNWQREHLAQLRTSLFRFGMACIALEDTLAGGGTYSVHEPRYLPAYEEEALYDVIRGRNYANRADIMPMLKAQINRYIRWEPRNHRVLGGFADAQDVHKWARRIDLHMKESLSLARKLHPQATPRILTFMRLYLLDYLGVRGANRV